MKNALLAIFFLAAAPYLGAQSYHFSQFFSTPLLTNPANTGFTDGPYRFASNIRSQGLPGGTYFTGYLSADISPLRDRLPEGHRAGLGLYLMNDHALASAVQTNTVGASVAYNVGLDPYGENSIGVGLQATYQQRRIDYSKLTFESQFGSNGYDGSLPVGEPLDVNSKHFFDANAGVTYRRTIENKSFFLGAAVYNVLQHGENMLAQEFQAPRRYTLQAGTQVSTADNSNVYFSLTSMHQARTSEVTLGGAYGLALSTEEKNELTGGLWYRYKDAVIPYIGYQRRGFQLGLSYDNTVSAAKVGSQVRNAFELTLLYKGLDVRELKTVIPWY